MNFDYGKYVIKSEMPAVERWDVMQGAERMAINVDGQHGFVALVDIMPRLCPAGKFADHAIVQAARVSYGDGTKHVNEDTGLIRYLYRHTHTTPFEMVEVKLHAQMPLFIARQWIRHRTANVNEASARYSVMKDLRWLPRPDEIRAVSNKNKQVSEGLVDTDTAEDFCDYVEKFGDQSYDQYQKFVKANVGREIARVALPVNMYTEWYFKIDLHNLFHFLGLRMHEHAQKEMRDYANAIFALISPMVPAAAKAFMDYHPNMGGMKLTALEIDAINRGGIQEVGEEMNALGQRQEVWMPGEFLSDNKREKEEFQVKLKRLGLSQ
jgi:thymidylate synthase (FAD)